MLTLFVRTDKSCSKRAVLCSLTTPSSSFSLQPFILRSLLSPARVSSILLLLSLRLNSELSTENERPGLRRGEGARQEDQERKGALPDQVGRLRRPRGHHVRFRHLVL